MSGATVTVRKTRQRVMGNSFSLSVEGIEWKTQGATFAALVSRMRAVCHRKVIKKRGNVKWWGRADQADPGVPWVEGDTEKRGRGRPI